MKRAHGGIISACSWRAQHAGALIIGLVTFWIASTPRPTWGQSAWPSYPNNSVISVTSGGNVGIGTTNPTSALSLVGGGSAGGTNDPSLNYNASNTFQLASGVPGVALAGGVLTAPPNSFWLQVRSANATGYSYPLVLNPLGGNIGIGTPAPTFKLHVAASASGDGIAIRRAGPGAATVLQFQNEVGTNGAKIYTSGTNDSLILAAAGGSDAQTLLANGNVGIGTADPGAYKLAVNGPVRAKEVVVDSGWSDYVFAPQYRLASLKDVAAYISKNRHLPDIPSGTEVEEEGVSIGAMQAKLLAKIEELTLHVIRESERNDRLEQRSRELEERLVRMEGRQ